MFCSQKIIVSKKMRMGRNLKCIDLNDSEYWKMWVTVKPNGYIMHVDPYYTLKGCQGKKIQCDKLFTSVALLVELCKRKLDATGSLRGKRTGKALNLPRKKTLMKLLEMEN